MEEIIQEHFSKLIDTHILELKGPSTMDQNKPTEADHHGISEHQRQKENSKCLREDDNRSYINNEEIKWFFSSSTGN